MTVQFTCFKFTQERPTSPSKINFVIYLFMTRFDSTFFLALEIDAQMKTLERNPFQFSIFNFPLRSGTSTKAPHPIIYFTKSKNNNKILGCLRARDPYICCLYSARDPSHQKRGIYVLESWLSDTLHGWTRGSHVAPSTSLYKERPPFLSVTTSTSSKNF